MSRPKLNIAMIGYQFMGKAHSNAYRQVARMMHPAAEPVMQVLVGRQVAAVRAAAEQYGWRETATDWRMVMTRPDIDVIDIATTNNLHAEIALAALHAGKHVLCEKPLATTLQDARTMVSAAQHSRLTAMVNFNYRACPAVALAKQLIDEGRLGRIFHWRAVYLQDWLVDPNVPRQWKLTRTFAGSGAHGDINAHIIDLARWLVGEIGEVSTTMETFTHARPAGGGDTTLLPVDVDDAVVSLARFANGALGTFEASRYASGHKNGWEFEINGSNGSLRCNFERMNELEFYDRTVPAHIQGFRTILASDPAHHPYMQDWWPVGHIIGYEHTFTHQIANFLTAVARGEPVSPSFLEGAKVNAVLDAMTQSASTRQWVSVPEI